MGSVVFLQRSFTIVLSIVVGLYLWKLLEEKGDFIIGGGGGLLLNDGRHPIVNVNKAYCADCKALWTPQGWIEYLVLKGRGPPVIVLHGAPGGVDQALLLANELFPSTKDPSPLVPVAQENLTPTERLLLKQRKPPYTLIVVSRPGYLRTSLNENTMTMEQQSNFLGLLLDELDLDSAAVIGIAAGGAYALDYAHRYPNRCWGLVLVGGIPFNAYSHWAIMANHLLTQFMPKSIYNYLYTLIEKGLKSNWLTDSRDFKMLLTATTLFPFREEGYKNDITQLSTLTTDKISKMLSNVTVPTLIVQGTGPQPTTPTTSSKKNAQQQQQQEGAKPRLVVTVIPEMDESQFLLPYNKVARAIDAFFEERSEFLVYPEYPEGTPLSTAL